MADFRLPQKVRAGPAVFEILLVPGLSLGVAGEMTIDAFWQQTFAAALTTTREGGAPAFGPHARTKTVLLLSCALGSL
jgi:hypothetical protein